MTEWLLMIVLGLLALCLGALITEAMLRADERHRRHLRELEKPGGKGK